MPQLNPEVGIPVIQLVGPETSEKELQELFLEVYKLHRLPGSPPGEPALMEEVVSPLKDCQGQKEKRTSVATARSQTTDAQPSRSKASWKCINVMRVGILIVVLLLVFLLLPIVHTVGTTNW